MYGPEFSRATSGLLRGLQTSLLRTALQTRRSRPFGINPELASSGPIARVNSGCPVTARPATVIGSQSLGRQCRVRRARLTRADDLDGARRVFANAKKNSPWTMPASRISVRPGASGVVAHRVVRPAGWTDHGP